MRIMRTNYRIDDYQDVYFVIDSFDQLYEATRPDFTPYYETLMGESAFEPGELLSSDRSSLRIRRHKPCPQLGLEDLA